MIISLLICLFFAIYLLLGKYGFFNANARKGFPPGPRQIPLVGNLLQFSRNPLKVLSQWKQEYPRIMGCQLGEFRAVVLNDMDVMKTAFNNPAFNGRPPFLPALIFSGGSHRGTLTSDGSTAKTLRNITLKNLSRLGFGSSANLSESKIGAELCSQVRATGGRPTDLRPEFYFPVASYVWSVLAGSSGIPTKEKSFVTRCFSQLHDILWQPIGSPVWMLPQLASFLQGGILQGLSATVAPFHNVINMETLSSVRNFKENFFTAFLLDMRKESSFQEAVENGTHLQGTVMNLWTTAGESISNVLSWVTMYLALYPDVQQKLAYEILVNREGTTKDNNNCSRDDNRYPYTRAVIKEVLRISSTSPFANFHYTLEDCQLEGYIIPRDTLVIGNLYGHHHDPNIWKDPEVFDPERFLSKEAPEIFPFSIGQRSCIGQSFAKNYLFTSIHALVSEFVFFWDPKSPKLSTEEITNDSHVSIFRFPPKHKVVCMDRRLYNPDPSL